MNVDRELEMLQELSRLTGDAYRAARNSAEEAQIAKGKARAAFYEIEARLELKLESLGLKGALDGQKRKD